jgi:hypothetical protein
MPQALGTDTFWDIYRTLDDQGTIRHDFTELLHHIWQGRGGFARVARMLVDRIRWGRSPKRIRAS